MSPANPSVDGRRLRRDRNRETVVEALLELYREGNLSPSTDDIAARAGISARSVFRYFDDTDALVRTAVARQQEHLAPLYELTASADQPRAERIERFCADRLRLLEAMGPVGQLARSVGVRQPVVAQELGRIRAVLRSQVADLFADALSEVDPGERASVLAALDVATSWEAHHLLRTDQRLSRPATQRAMATAVRRLLASGEAA
jgi:AcrR family transcriptional regulator